MDVFWHVLLKGLVTDYQANHLIEVGANKGENTLNLLAYSEEAGIPLTIIDPKTCFSSDIITSLEKASAAKRVAELSLEALPETPTDGAVVFLDGDHNYYTVYNELKIIFGKSNERIPLVLLHDVSWPYERNDLYYNPDNIPDEARRPYHTKGLSLYSKHLRKMIGPMNVGLTHVERGIHPDNPKIGVLTAVEDFITQSDLDLELVRVPASFGLGILTTREEMRALSSVEGIKQFLTNQVGVDLLELTEHLRIDAVVRFLNTSHERDRLGAEKQELRSELNRLKKRNWWQRLLNRG